MNYLPTDLPTTELVTSLYAGLANDDIEAILPILSPDTVLHVPGTQPLAGDHRGLGEILTFLLATSATSESGETIELIDVLVGEQHAGAYVRVTAERAGRPPLDNHTVHLLRFEHGLIAEIWFHNRDQAAVDAFWS